MIKRIAILLLLIDRLIQRSLRITYSLCYQTLLGSDRISVQHGSIISTNSRTKIGANFYSNGKVWIEAISRYEGQRYEGRIEIGANVRSSNNLHISAISSIHVGDNVLFGSNVLVVDHSHGQYRSFPASSPDSPPSSRPLSDAESIDIGDNVWIGDNVVILSGSRVGAGSIIGANSVIRGKFPNNSIVAGNPAKTLKQYSRGQQTWNKI